MKHSVVNFAVSAYDGIYRKYDEMPYIVHPFEVLKLIVGLDIKDEVMHNAALCHDIKEEAPHISYGEIEREIGTEAMEIVKELTFEPMRNGIPTHLQKAAYINGLACASPKALVIKLADRMCNSLDFMKHDQKYAVKYWNKASVLCDAFHDRDDIINVIGVEPFAKLRTMLSLVPGVIG